MRSPRTWTVQRIRVKMPNDLEASIAASLNTPHILVFGEMGVGKSALLNAVNKGKRDCMNDLEFKSGTGEKAVTREVRSKLVQIDHQETTRNVRLTDIPGFNDPHQKNEATIE